MNLESLRTYALSFKGVTESFPFDTDTLVFKVGGKMFLLTSVTSIPLQFNVKCDPEKAIELRERFQAVTPGFHMNKQHWNTIYNEMDASDMQMKEWIKDSYELIKSSLPKKKQVEIDSEI
jgi:predicted DNA-binding protein (MmcQ/YjbR family)